MKTTILNKKLIITVLAFFTAALTLIGGNPLKEESWKLLTEQSGIQVFYRYENCDDNVNDIHQKLAVLKIVNTTGKDLTVEWDLETWYNNICTTCNNKNKEQHFELQIKAGETKSGNCETRATQRELLIFAKFTNMENKVELTKFNLANLKVSIL